MSPFRIALAALVFLSWLPGSGAEEKISAYPIRSMKIDSAKFQRVYESYVASEKRKSSMPKTKLVVLGKIGGDRYLALATFSSPGKKAKNEEPEIIAVDLEAGQNPGAGDTVKEKIENTGETVTHGSGDGKKTKARLFKIRTEKEPYTQKSLYYFIQSGGSLVVDVPTKVRCQTCRGFGKISDFSKNASPDKKKPCPDCEEGFVDSLKVLQLQW